MISQMPAAMLRPLAHEIADLLESAMASSFWLLQLFMESPQAGTVPGPHTELN